MGAFLALPSMASAATRLVSPSGADVGDCTVLACQHIQYAVTQAVSGDTVSVAAGTYNSEPSNRVLINKGLTLQGAGIGQTILDGNSAHGLPASGTLRIDSTSTAPITVAGLTVRGAGSTAATHGSDNHFAVFVQGLGATPASWTFDQIRVEGSGSTTGRDYNMDVQLTNANVVVQNSQFVDANFNSILVERAQGTTDFNGNTITKGPGSGSAYFDMNHLPNAGNPTGITGLHRFRNNVVDGNGNNPVSFTSGFLGDNRGPYSAIQVTGNTLSNPGAAGIAINISNNGSGDGTATLIGDADVTGNTINSPGGTGIRFRGLIQGIDATTNQIVGFTRGIQFAAATAGHVPAAAEVHFNRLVNDSTAGLDNAAGGAVDAENNWWGCNEGPNADPGCSPVLGTSIDFDPWLVLTLSASPTSIEVGGQTSQITADLNKNSNGQTVGTAHPDGFPVAFGTDLGTINPTSVPLASGIAQSTLTSGAQAGTANVAATVDNETATTPVTITDTTPPDTTITAGPANGASISDSTPTFSFNSPGEPSATFECSLDGAAFAACTSPYTTPPLGQGEHSFAVRAIDPAGNPDPSPATRGFTVDTLAPNTTITSGPVNGSTINDPTPSFQFSSNDPVADFECSVDGGAFAACNSPFTTQPLADGPHGFAVRAIDAAGNRDPTPATRAFIVDATPPNTQIDSGPTSAATIAANTATFTFSSPGEPSASFQCRIDSSDPVDFAACTSPFTTPPLSDGPHKFEVRAVDSNGNVDPSPALALFRVDTTPAGAVLGTSIQSAGGYILRFRVGCPKKAKRRCRIRMVGLLAGRGSARVTSVGKKRIKPGKQRTLELTIQPFFLAQVQAKAKMLFKQAIRLNGHTKRKFRTLAVVRR